MKLHVSIFTGAVIAAASMGGYFSLPTNSVTPVPKQHTKLFYDRIMPSLNATVINYRAGDLTIEKSALAIPDIKVLPPIPSAPCLMKSRKRSKVDGRCYLEARLPENQ